MSHDAIPQDRALTIQLAMIAGGEPESSYLEIRPLDPLGRQRFVSVRDINSAAAVIAQLASRHNVYVGAAPRVQRSGTASATARVWCLWADCDSPEAVERLSTFRPLPNIVVRSGTAGNVHAWWQLAEPVSPAQAVRANRRLALALGADRAATDAARIMRPVGSLNHKHRPARQVECVRLELDTFTVGDVVQGLADDAAYAPRLERPSRKTGDGAGALAGIVRVVRASPVGERNHRLNWAAFKAGEHVADGRLNEAEVEAALLPAAVDVGLSEPEALRTIRSGLDAAGRRAA